MTDFCQQGDPDHIDGVSGQPEIASTIQDTLQLKLLIIEKNINSNCLVKLIDYVSKDYFSICYHSVGLDQNSKVEMAW